MTPREKVLSIGVGVAVTLAVGSYAWSSIRNGLRLKQARVDQLQTEITKRDTAITDAGLEPLLSLSRLKVLNLVNTKITDAGFVKVADQLKQLTALNLLKTGVTDAGLKTLRHLEELEVLVLPPSATDASMSFSESISPLLIARTRPSTALGFFVARTGKRVSLHAETNEIMVRRELRMRGAGRIDPLAHIASRPAVVAVEAVSRAAILAEWTGARINILHISSAEELRPLREAKARGVDITGETCPHYVLLSTDDYARFRGVIRVNPPVREARNQQPLWDALADGTIDVIATDHAPHSQEEKTRNDIWTVDCGFPGVETQMPLMLNEVSAGRFGICDYVRWSAANVAKIWGLYPRKGVIQPSADADIAVVDLAREWTIDDAKLQSLSRITPFHGMRVKGLPIHTLVRGRFVMKDRTLMPGTRGWGQSVHPIQNMPPPVLKNTDSTMSEIVRAGTRVSQEHAA